MGKISIKYMTEMVLCACGCGIKISKYSKYGRITRYAPSHQLAESREKRVVGRKGGSKKGQIPWNKGIEMSAESCKNYFGRKHSKEHNEKISARLIGNKYAVGSKGSSTSFKKGQTTGDKNKNWKGGISKDVWKIRGSFECAQWKKEVKKRDKNTCKRCCIKSFKKTTAHHVLNFSTHIDLRFSIENGITLCIKCHKKFHDKYGYRNNNAEQLEEFIKDNRIKTIYLPDYNFESDISLAS